MSTFLHNQNKTLDQIKEGLKFSCLMPDHELNNLNFVCMKEDCAEQRLSCTHCLIEQHRGHTEERVTLKNFYQIVIGKFQDRFLRIEDLNNGILAS